MSNLYARAPQQELNSDQRLAFQPASKDYTDKIYIFRQCTNFVYLLIF